MTTLRRGKPTNHKVFGEDLALLAGDALLTYVFEVFAQNGKIKSVGAANTLNALQNFAHRAGASGMVGGQTADVYAEGMGTHDAASLRAEKIKKASKKLADKSLHYFLLPPSVKETTPENVLLYIHANKTGALIRASVETGALLAGAQGADLKHIQKYADCIGLVFQIVDDILDVTATAKQLGKSNSDAQNGKLTFVSLFGAGRQAANTRSCLSPELKKRWTASKTSNAKTWPRCMAWPNFSKTALIKESA